MDANQEAEKPQSVRSRTETELIALARALATNLIFTDRHCRTVEEIGIAFMPIGMGALHECAESFRNDIGLIFEYLDKAGPRSINGLPCFFSAHYVSKSDTKILMEHYTQMHNALHPNGNDRANV